MICDVNKTLEMIETLAEIETKMLSKFIAREKV
jgi:hypothetical protein